MCKGGARNRVGGVDCRVQIRERTGDTRSDGRGVKCVAAILSDSNVVHCEAPYDQIDMTYTCD